MTDADLCRALAERFEPEPGEHWNILSPKGMWVWLPGSQRWVPREFCNETNGNDALVTAFLASDACLPGFDASTPKEFSHGMLSCDRSETGSVAEAHARNSGGSWELSTVMNINWMRAVAEAIARAVGVWVVE